MCRAAPPWGKSSSHPPASPRGPRWWWARPSIAAARAALLGGEGVAANLAGGTHHAYAHKGSGFCVFNDVAVAADWVRPGIALYGSSPDFPAHSAADWDLKPAMSLHANIMAVQHLQVGDSVGYGSSFVADQAMRIGVVACGYADGYPRHAPTGTPVLVDGVRTRVVGRVSMDMLTVDLTALDAAGYVVKMHAVGDRAVQAGLDAIAAARAGASVAGSVDSTGCAWARVHRGTKPNAASSNSCVGRTQRGGNRFIQGLFRQHAHRVFQALQGQRVHALAHELLDDADALSILPHALGLGVDPGKFGERVCEPL